LAHTSEQEHEANFVKVFIGVLIALTLFTLFCIFVARGLAAGSNDPNDSILREALVERIAPVASVNTSADQIDAATASASADVGTSAEPQSGEQIVSVACAACHAAGVANAPKIDDAEAWSQRREAGLEALVASVINGKGAMPARAGTDLTDEKITLAVQHMAGFETESGAAAVETTESSTDANSTATASTANTANGGTIELSEKAKSVADSLCVGCHLSGVANAPKLGDKAEWDKRAEKGMDELVKTVVTGQGAMPPRGGSDLTDEELAGAIQYLMSK